MPEAATNSKVLLFTQKKKVYVRSSTGYKSNGIKCAHAADAIPQEDLARIKEYLLSGKTRYGLRNWTIIALGVSVGGRCGDICKLRVGDVWDGENVKQKVEFTAQKTRTSEVFWLNDSIREVLREYILKTNRTNPNFYLFASERSDHMTTKSMLKVFYNVREKLGITYHLSTHSMRKTLGKHAYRTYGLSATREILRQRSEQSTLHYIGETESEIRKNMLNLPNLV